MPYPLARVQIPRTDSESDSLPGMSFSKDWVRTPGSRRVVCVSPSKRNCAHTVDLFFLSPRCMRDREAVQLRCLNHKRSHT
ncbi:hypothetical protein M404DRAFT_1007608 [Pisolithus tinctorius Marx 270]|uniref:Uncharacterized protein n=1 Tax=Pisolithus tinctorius Marx 270 TaxID=870435 RepID=A0A0C3N2M2_PISTI|nr:hypothetical protein M404DRAFT_1007608 [Pisolithus tinctorius Marx 270]